MNTETLTALVTEWRAAATLSDDASKPEGNYILEAMASGSRDAFTECADHLESAIAAAPTEPEVSEAVKVVIASMRKHEKMASSGDGSDRVAEAEATVLAHYASRLEAALRQPTEGEK